MDSFEIGAQVLRKACMLRFSEMAQSEDRDVASLRTRSGTGRMFFELDSSMAEEI